MRSGSQSRFKRHKMGMLPGDISLHTKIAMLEKCHEPDVQPDKSFREFQRERAEAAFRQSEDQEIQGQLNDNDE